MRASTITAALAFAAGTQAYTPFTAWYSRWGPGNKNPAPAPLLSVACLNVTGVMTLIEGYTYLLEYPGGTAFNSTANAILADTFSVLSDSILTLSQRPLGQPAYASKEVFIDTQFQTPPLPIVQTLGVFATCDKIAWRWNASGIGSNEYEIKGIITMDVDPVEVQITTLYSEFNSAAFEADLGYPECQ